MVLTCLLLKMHQKQCSVNVLWNRKKQNNFLFSSGFHSSWFLVLRLQNEINRRLDIIKSITYQPPLLKKSDEIFFEDEYSDHMPCHLYRMKALDSLPSLDSAVLSVDPSKVRPFHQNYRVYLIKLAKSGLFGNTEMNIIHKFADLYEHARHDAKAFNEEEYIQFVTLMMQIRENIPNRSSHCHQNLNQAQLKASQTAESVKISSCEKTTTRDKCTDTESSDKDKAAYETCV